MKLILLQYLYTLECPTDQVVLGLITSTSSNPQGTPTSGNIVSRSPGSAFRFQDGQTSQTIPGIDLNQCLTICRQINTCTAAMYQNGCNGGTRSCTFIETKGSLSVISSSTTATAACTGNTFDGSSVYVKYCMYVIVYHQIIMLILFCPEIKSL